MAQENTLEFDRLPSVAPYYARAVARRGGRLSDQKTVPPIHAGIDSLVAPAGPLARYREVCGFTDSDRLPVTYPHALAFPLHMAVMTHRRFPLRLMGLIHVRNRITQYRAIDADEYFSLRVSVDGHRAVSKGVEFDLITVVDDAQGKPIWHEASAMLSRQPSQTKGAPPRDKPARNRDHKDEEFTPEARQTWQVPADIGRRYAAAAGDYNPIHLSAWTARLFGFRRAIATGMWTVARAAAAVQPLVCSDAYDLAVAFRQPIFLPSAVALSYASGNDGVDFAIGGPDGDASHLRGRLQYR